VIWQALKEPARWQKRQMADGKSGAFSHLPSTIAM
jgi:hypothetical protein